MPHFPALAGYAAADNLEVQNHKLRATLSKGAEVIIATPPHAQMKRREARGISTSKQKARSGELFGKWSKESDSRTHTRQHAAQVNQHMCRVQNVSARTLVPGDVPDAAHALDITAAAQHQTYQGIVPRLRR